MAKFRPIDGKMTGKLGGRVYAVRGGVQIVRERPLSIYNPKSNAQVEVRAKLKLASQLSELMAPFIAIPRKGNVSARNTFVKINYPSIEYAVDVASIQEASIQLTDSSYQLSGLSVSRDASNIISAALGGVNAGGQLNKMVYIAFSRVYDTFKLVESKVVSEAGQDNTFPTTFGPVGNSKIIILAYGIREMSDKARVYFSNLQTLSAETLAKIVVTRVLSESDILTTVTVGASSEPQA